MAWAMRNLQRVQKSYHSFSFSKKRRRSRRMREEPFEFGLTGRLLGLLRLPPATWKWEGRPGTVWRRRRGRRSLQSVEAAAGHRRFNARRRAACVERISPLLRPVLPTWIHTTHTHTKRYRSCSGQQRNRSSSLRLYPVPTSNRGNGGAERTDPTVDLIRRWIAPSCRLLTRETKFKLFQFISNEFINYYYCCWIIIMVIWNILNQFKMN